MGLFARLEAVEWEKLQHAYGPADDVPAIIRGLVSSSPKERESALDGMYGAVHHQGDIYDSTVASIPFLFEVLASRTLPGRADVVALIASIGASALGRTTANDESARVAAAALAAVRREEHQLVEAVSDASAEVRRAAPRALGCCEDAARPASALLAQFAVESDLEARREQAAAISALMRRSGQVDDLRGWLTPIASGDPDSALRLQAVTTLLTLQPDVTGLLETARTALRTFYDGPPAPLADRGAGTNTLIGALRAMHGQSTRGRTAPELGRALHELGDALGERVDERAALLLDLVRSDRWEMLDDALGPLKVLVGNWRGRYDTVVAALGRQLIHGPARCVDRITSLLKDLFELSAPAADGLAHGLAVAEREGPSELFATGHPPWVVRYGDGQRSCGAGLTALARAGDRRAVPAFAELIENGPIPADLGFAIEHLGARATPLVPGMVKLLQKPHPVDPHGQKMALPGLIYAVSLAGAAGLPALESLMRVAPDNELAVRAIGRFGPSARKAVPVLKKLLDHRNPRVSVAAGVALLNIAPDSVPLGPVFVRHLKDPEAIRGLSRLGPVAAHRARLEALLTESPAHAAAALWRLGGSDDLALSHMKKVWREAPWSRAGFASVLIERRDATGSMTAELRGELARRRRYNASDDSWGSHQIQDDEALLRACRQALAVDEASA